MADQPRQPCSSHAFRPGIWVAMLTLTACIEPEDDPSVEGVPLTACADIQDLEGVRDCVETHHLTEDTPPAPNDDPWLATSLMAQVSKVLSQGCDAVGPESLPDGFSLSSIDLGWGERGCVLLESLDRNGDNLFDRGVAAMLLREQPEVEIDLQVPHPFFETGTLDQGLEVFRSLPLRSLLISTSHRHADPSESTCQSDYSASDPVHNEGTLFDVSAKAFLASTQAIVQFHGMAEESCAPLDLYISEGVDDGLQPDGFGAKLTAAARRVFGAVATAGDQVCDLVGTHNIVGRVANGSGDTCDDGAEDASGRFVHVEQVAEARDPDTWVDLLSRAVDGG